VGERDVTRVKAFDPGMIGARSLWRKKLPVIILVASSRSWT
jgi:hypothetical protein